MGINLFNGVVNGKQSPAIFADSGLNANDVAIGTIYFDSGNQAIFRSEGAEGAHTWVAYSGAGGSQDLQSVLDLGNSALNQSIILTNDDAGEISQFFSNAIYLYKDDNREQYLTAINNSLSIVTPTTVITLGENYLSAFESVNNNTITARLNAIDTLFQIEYNGNANGLKLDWANNAFSLGDYANLGGHTYIQIDDDSNNINLNYEGKLNLNGTLVTSATSGSNASLHLVVWINGSQYKIQLKNP